VKKKVITSPPEIPPEKSGEGGGKESSKERDATTSSSTAIKNSTRLFQSEKGTVDLTWNVVRSQKFYGLSRGEREGIEASGATEGGGRKGNM